MVVNSCDDCIVMAIPRHHGDFGFEVAFLFIQWFSTKEKITFLELGSYFCHKNQTKAHISHEPICFLPVVMMRLPVYTDLQIYTVDFCFLFGFVEGNINL